MTLRHKSLVQSLLGSLLVPGLAVMVIGVLIVQHIFKDEYDAVSYTHLTLPTSDLV